MPNLVFDPKYWGDRAEETRAYAEQFNDAEAPRVLLNVAASYDRLAELAANMSRAKPKDQSARYNSN